MHTTTVYSPQGEPFQVPQPRLFGLLARGWTLTKTEKKPETHQRPVKTETVKEKVKEKIEEKSGDE